MPDLRIGARWLLAVSLAPLAAALWQLFPAWLYADRAVVGDWLHPDMISNHWLYCWMRDQIRSGGSLLHNDRYYFPIGDAPWLAGNGSDAFAWMLLGAWLPWPASMTAWALLIIALNGISGAVLSKVLGARLPGAVVGGALLAMSPYVAYELSCARFAQAPLFWLAFFLAAWVRLLEAPGVRRGVLAGLLYGITAFTYWYYGLWAAVAGAILFAFQVRPSALLAFVPTALAAVLPPLWLFLRHWSSIPGTQDEQFPHPLAQRSGLFAGFPIWGASSSLQSLVLPLTLLALAALALRHRPWSRTTRGLLLIAGLFYLLALGPVLIGPDGEPSAVAGLYQLVYSPLGVLRRYWWPYRHIAVLTLALIPLAACGADRLLERLGRRWPLGAAALVLCIPLEIHARGGLSTIRLSSWSAPPIYAALAELPDGVVLELPLSPQLAATQPALSYQWIHGKRLLNGHAMWVDRVRPQAWDAWVAQQPLLVAIGQAEQGKGPRTLTIAAADVTALRAEGLRYIVLNTEYFPGELAVVVSVEHHLLTTLFGTPVLTQEDTVQIFDLERYTGVTTLTVPAVTLPEDALARDGTLMPRASNRTSLGWQPMDRSWTDPVPAVRPADAELPEMLRRRLQREQRKQQRLPGGSTP